MKNFRMNGSKHITRSQGFSLIEFMVAMTISLMVVGGAAAIYLNSSLTQRVMTERQNMFEGAKVTMDIIGRDLENAGFYPTESSPALGPTVAAVGYQNPCINPRDNAVSFCDFTAPTVFDRAVFGCAGQRLTRSGSGSSVAYACAALPTGVSGTDADSLVVNYFTSDAGGLGIGQRGDCEGQDVAKDAINSRNSTAPTASPLANPNRLTYTGAVPSPIAATLAPSLPLFVSNRYTLVPVNSSSATTAQKEKLDGQLITTFSVACDGNGNDNDGNTALASTAQPMLSGVSQLKFRFLQKDAAGTGQYLAASSVTDWGLVVAVRVCVLAHTYRTANIPSYTLQDCNGTSQTFADGISRRAFSQVFALKNVLM